MVVGYNEIPFAEYESFLRKYGEETEAYRDLKFSFVDLDGKKLDYIGLLNHAFEETRRPEITSFSQEAFRSGDIPNLAAVYLTNFLRRKGHNACYVNLFQYEKEKFAELLAQHPLCVAITTTFYVVNLPVNQMVEFIREHNDQVKIIVGGPLIANHARNYHGDEFKTAVQDIGADICVIEGQGEATLSQIIDCLKNGGSLSAVPNIAYLENGTLCRTKVVPENNSLDENYIDWRSFGDEEPGATIQTRTARSCAFKCSFCITQPERVHWR